MLNTQTATRSRFLVSWRIWSKINPTSWAAFGQGRSRDYAFYGHCQAPCFKTHDWRHEDGLCHSMLETPNYLRHGVSSRSAQLADTVRLHRILEV